MIKMKNLLLATALATTSVVALHEAEAARAARAAAPSRPEKPKADAAKIASLTRSMTKDVQNGVTPFLEFVPATKGVKLRQTVQPDYGSNGGAQTSATYTVRGLPTSGLFSMTLLLPVSGHVGLSAARGYAKSNRYNVQLVAANGTTKSKSGIPSAGFVTPKTVDFKLASGRNEVRFWADGSGGVYGYSAGRLIVLDWNGK